MQMNLKKTNYIVFSQNRSIPDDSDLKIMIDGTTKGKVDSTRYPGLVLDSKLNHIKIRIRPYIFALR